MEDQEEEEVMVPLSPSPPPAPYVVSSSRGGEARVKSGGGPGRLGKKEEKLK